MMLKVWELLVALLLSFLLFISLSKRSSELSSFLFSFLDKDEAFDSLNSLSRPRLEFLERAEVVP